MKKLIQIAHHRNGCSGEPFYAVVFQETDGGETTRMLAVRFADEERSDIRCAVFDIGKLSGDNPVKFAWNSWRGDRYHSWVDEQIRIYESK